jgi:hypothetical protein
VVRPKIPLEPGVVLSVRASLLSFLGLYP